MLDRLTYALIGALLGILLAMLVWFFFGSGWNYRFPAGGGTGDLLTWTKVSSCVCAGVGFVFKERVGTFVGSIVEGVIEAMTRSDVESPQVPTWLAVLLLVAIAGVVVYWLS